MKRTLSIIIILEILLSSVMFALGLSMGGSFAAMMTFPFEQISNGLRYLSLSGSAGNTLAVVLYCLVCLLPTIYLAIRAMRKKIHLEDGLLALLSLALFAVIYLMINPGDITRHFGTPEMLDTSKALCGSVVYSVLVGYIVLRAMRVFTGSEVESMMKYLKIFVGGLCVIFVYVIFSSGLTGLVNAVQQLTLSNTAADTSALLPSYLFLGLQYLVDILPYAFSIAVAFAGLNLIGALEADAYGKSVAASARKIGGICKLAVVCIMLSQIAVNILQLALGSIIRSSHYTLSIPLLSVVFVLAALLLARYFEQARLLKDDNDSII